ncbi:LptF/LptG family permease [bacterium]|nr:LptF/LptG family permease [bacterium]
MFRRRDKAEAPTASADAEQALAAAAAAEAGAAGEAAADAADPGPLKGTPAASGKAAKDARDGKAGKTPEPEQRKGNGTALTLHFALDGTMTNIGVSRERSRRQRAAAAKRVSLGGHELTEHVDLKRRRRSVVAVQQQMRRGSPLRQFFMGILYFLKWLFIPRFKILIIERYIWGEALGYFLVGSMAFTFFMIVTTVFTLGEKIFTKNIPPFTVTKVLLLSAPAFLVLAIPVALLFATLMCMNRLNRDNEIIAMTTNGVSLYRIFTPFIALAIGAGIMTWYIYEHVVPPNNRTYKETLKVFWEAQVVDFIKEGIVISAPDRKFFYVDHINKEEGVMYGLRLYDFFKEDKSKRNFPRIFLAEQAYIRDQFLVLQGVTFFELDQTSGDTLVQANMEQVRIDIGTKLSEYPLTPHPTELSATDLRTRIQRNRDSLAARKFPDPGLFARFNRDMTEYYFKYSIPLACLAFVLVAVPVSLRGPRDERNMGLILTFVLVMIYYVIFFTCREVGSRGVMVQKPIIVAGKTIVPQGGNAFPPYIAGWLAPSVFFVGAAFLIWKARK